MPAIFPSFAQSPPKRNFSRGFFILALGCAALALAAGVLATRRHFKSTMAAFDNIPPRKGEPSAAPQAPVPPAAQNFSPVQNALALFVRGPFHYAESLAILEEAKAAGLMKPPLYYVTGVMRQNKGDLATAAEEFEQWLSHRPGHRGARLRLAGLYETLGRRDMALKHHRRLLEMNPQDPEAVMELAAVYIAQSRWEEGGALLRNVLKKEGRLSPRGYLLLGQSFRGLVNMAAAVAAYQTGLALYDNDPGLLLALARTYEEMGETTRASVCRRRLALVSPHASTP